MHNSWLSGIGCERGLQPSATGPHTPAVDAFFEGACAARPFPIGVKRPATFTGTFRLRRNGQRTIYVLDIDTVENIEAPQPPDAAPHPEPTHLP